MNSINIMGYIVRELELKTGGSGKSYCKFAIGVRRRFDKDKTDFFNITAFGKTSEFICEYFNKGSKIAITGSLSTSSYEKNGENRTSVDIIVDQVDFADSKSEGKEKLHVSAVDGVPKDDSDSFPF